MSTTKRAPAPRRGGRRRAVAAGLVAVATSLLLVTGAQATPTGGQPSISGSALEGFDPDPGTRNLDPGAAESER
ncbi:MAG TPA: hypothetical protein VG325_19585, partial [Solirubrobacteraceae bacterium]|nr:hypothetical protein [Solirubrobacteraceae bacterium]